jgi:hypothetical protein
MKYLSFDVVLVVGLSLSRLELNSQQQLREATGKGQPLRFASERDKANLRDRIELQLISQNAMLHVTIAKSAGLCCSLT